MSRVKISDVLMNIGRQIASDVTINQLAKNSFGKPFKVIVGGYAQKLASDSDTPFVWITPEDEEGNINGEGTRSLSAKIVLGVCPLKDVPSTTTMFDDSTRLWSSVKTNEVEYLDVLEIVGEQAEIYESLEALVEGVSVIRSTINADIEAAKSAGESGDWQTMVAKIRDAVVQAAGVREKHVSIAALVDTEVYPRAEAHLDAAEENLDVIDEISTSVTGDVNAVSSAFEQYEEDPFISTVFSERTDETSGLVAYGAITIMDDFSDQLSKILDEENFGMPLASMSVKNQSVSHYPLDWMEFTVKFEKQETLSL